MKRTGMEMKLAAAFLTACSLAAAEWTLEWRTVDGGGAMRSTGGRYELSGTLGQFDAGEGGSASLALRGGFWFHDVPACARDGVGPDDADDFAQCAQGPDMRVSSSVCECLDFDGDGDVDLGDQAEFQVMFTTAR